MDIFVSTSSMYQVRSDEVARARKYLSFIYVILIL